MQISEQNIENGLIFEHGIAWDKGLTEFGVAAARNSMRELLEAALSTGAEPVKTAPAVAVKAAMTDDEIYHWIAACNHEPARETLRHYLSLRSAISAQVQDVVDTETYYTTENNWENMFFGHGVSKTEMDVIWDFAKQNWANADFKITMTASPASKHGDAE